MLHGLLSRLSYANVVATVAVFLALGGGVTAASANTVTYTFPADTNVQPFYRWTVPAGVCLATFDLYGAEGSGGVGGAQVTSTIAVTPGAALDIYIGDWGVVGRGGYNGGGGASGGGVGGGGATDVRDGPALTDRLLVAGGGGGNGGYGSRSTTGIGGVGALVGQAGTSAGFKYSGQGGGGGTATTGGTGGNPGHEGTLGFGGAGEVGDPTVGGGGGGGGLWGGGGGGTGFYGDPGGGGGGGSSLTAGGTVSATPHDGRGKAIITWEPSSNCNAAGGSPGATLALPTGTNPTVGIARVGTRLTLEGRYALVKLQCIQVGTCRGSLSLATTGLPKSHKASAAKTTQTKLGSARFSIPALKTRTVKVKLSRTLSKRLAALSARRLKRLKIVATATVGAKTTKFSLGATRKR